MSEKERHVQADECELAQRFIAAFVVEHPGAADTTEGIARWWFEANRLPISPPVLQRALEHLVRRGVLRTRVLPSGATLWSAAGGGEGTELSEP